MDEDRLSEHADWQGKPIGHYQLEKPLGRGSASEVWLAMDRQLRRQVAIKLLPAIGRNQTYWRNFTTEVRAAASLEYAHILSIYDYGKQEMETGEHIPYLVLPFVPGGTLATRMQETTGLLATEESLRYLRHAAEALDYAHSQRVLHRDIKPTNMLLRDNWLLVTDFGLAHVLRERRASSSTGKHVSPSPYMAPEQITGRATPASDRYSLAVVAYELFTGSTPFSSAAAGALTGQAPTGPLPPRQLNAQIPPRVEEQLMVALSRNPELRPPSCLIFIKDLQKAWQSGQQDERSPDTTLFALWNRHRSEPLTRSETEEAHVTGQGTSSRFTRPSSELAETPPPGSTTMPLEHIPAVPEEEDSEITLLDLRQTRKFPDQQGTSK